MADSKTTSRRRTLLVLTVLSLAVSLACSLPPEWAAGAADGPVAGGHATLQYVGHSCFVITTSGSRLVIDPYASGEWPGLTLPYLHADRVLVTNPHWDHNAWR